MRLRIALLAAGLLAVVVGVALLSIPLGVIVAGVSAAATALLWPFSDGD